MPQRATTIVVMGVSGTGKTTIAHEIVSRLGWDFAEGDDFHPAANVAKMASGQPLDDTDRWPWLAALGGWISTQHHAGRSSVVTCSALKRSYRDVLRDGHRGVWFAHVSAPGTVLAERLEHRQGHYMPSSLLQSQLANLQPLQPDEAGITVAGDQSPHDVVNDILAALAVQQRASR